MLSLRPPSDYPPLCSQEPSEELRKVRSASEGGPCCQEWPSLPMSGPVPWFRHHEPLYQFPAPAYQRYMLPRPPCLVRPYPARRPCEAHGKEGSLKHRILHPPAAPPTRLSTRSGLHYPAYFIRGSIIQLGTGLLKKVEDLQTQDFVSSANASQDLRIDSSRVLEIAEASGDSVATLSFSVGQNQVQVTVEAPVEHPFFVFNRGWSSCNPERSLQRYRLECQRLSVGDVCISLTQRAGKPCRGAANAEPLGVRKRRWSAPDQVAQGLPVPQRTATT